MLFEVNYRHFQDYGHFNDQNMCFCFAFENWLYFPRWYYSPRKIVLRLRVIRNVRKGHSAFSPKHVFVRVIWFGTFGIYVPAYDLYIYLVTYR